MWSADRYNRALRFAGEWHREQKIPGSPIPYLLHLAQVSQQAMLGALNEPGLDIDLVMEAAILHDVLEDTECPYSLVEEEFGTAVAHGVLALSKHKVKEGRTLDKREQMLDSLQRIRQQPSEIWLVKLADRITNLETPPAHWFEKQGKFASYLSEAEIIYDQLSPASPYLADVMRQKMTDYRKHIG
jgi:(p)ppGpp synthase/HD superfamily hydrolase